MKRLRVGLRFRLNLAAAACALVAVHSDPVQFPEFSRDNAREYLTHVANRVAAELPDTPEAAYLLARVWDLLGFKEKAEQSARHALQSRSNWAEVRSFLAGLCIHQDRMREAADWLRPVVESQPGTPGAARQLGMVLDRLGDRDGARRCLEIATRVAPEDATACLVLGRLRLDDAQPQAALPWLQRACQLDPLLSGAFYALAQAQSAQGDAVGAEQSLRTYQSLKAREKAALDSRNTGYDDERFMRTLAAGFHTEVGTYGLRHRLWETSEAHLRQATRLTPRDSRPHELLAGLYLDQGRWEEAAGAAQAVVDLAPTNAAARANLGTVLLHRKEFARRVDELRHALELDPGQVEALNNLARYFLGTGQELPEALALSQRLVRQRPSAANYDLLGWASFANGQTNAARAAAAQAVEKDPANPIYRQRHQRLLSSP